MPNGSTFNPLVAGSTPATPAHRGVAQRQSSGGASLLSFTLVGPSQETRSRSQNKGPNADREYMWPVGCKPMQGSNPAAPPRGGVGEAKASFSRSPLSVRKLGMAGMPSRLHLENVPSRQSLFSHSNSSNHLSVGRRWWRAWSQHSRRSGRRSAQAEQASRRLRAHPWQRPTSAPSSSGVRG